MISTVKIVKVKTFFKNNNINPFIFEVVDLKATFSILFTEYQLSTRTMGIMNP